MQKPSREIESLTGLRGAAACFVMLYHFLQGATHLGPTRTFLLRGYLAVDLFFVLSGFVMALTYRHRFLGGASARAYLDFLFMRLARVYPLYLFITILFALFEWTGLVHRPEPSVGTAVANVFLIQAWGFAASIGGATWSISTEWAAYLLFPLGLSLVFGRRRYLYTALVFCVVILCVVASRTTGELHQGVRFAPGRNGALDVAGAGTIYPLLRCLAGFLLGLAAFRFMQGEVIRRIAARPAATYLVWGAALALMTSAGTDVALVILFVPLVMTLASGENVVTRFFRGRVLHWLGEISYSIYLSHLLVDALFRERLQGRLERLDVPHAFSVAALPQSLLVLVCSTVTYYGLERPARGWLRKVARWSSPVANTSDPAAS